MHTEIHLLNEWMMDFVEWKGQGKPIDYVY